MSEAIRGLRGSKSATRLQATLVAAAVAAAVIASVWPVAAHQHAGGLTGAARGLEALPLPARGMVARALGNGNRGFWARRAAGAFEFAGPTGRFTARLSSRGALIHTAAVAWPLGLRRYGYGLRLNDVGRSVPRMSGDRVTYARGGVEEWYTNGPLGLEQGFTLVKPPRGPRGAALTLDLGRLPRGTTLRMDADRRGLSLIARGQAVLRYASLFASDSSGHPLPARIDTSGGGLLLRIDDRGARYPLRVDPLIQAKLTASDGKGEDSLGESVAVSGDGTTIIAGAPYAQIGESETQGAVYVFTRGPSGWASSTQAAKLTASDGEAQDLLGTSVSIAGDGSTIVAGSPSAKVGENTQQGAVYVFLKPGGGWTDGTQSAKLTASDGAANDGLGQAVAMSGDGSTVVAGARSASVSGHMGQGAAYVFTEPKGGWVDGHQAAKLHASDGAIDDALGWSVAVAADGATVVAGAPLVKLEEHVNQGAAYVFVKPAEAPWSNAIQVAKLTASDGGFSDTLGYSLGVSSDGSTIAAGAAGATLEEERGRGAVYMFIRPGGGWADGNQAAKLTASDGREFDSLGGSVGLAADGAAVLAGASQATVSGHLDQGASYLFVRPGGGWANATQTAKVASSDGIENQQFGSAVAIAGDTLVAGARFTMIGENAGQGAAYVYSSSTTTTANCAPSSVSVGQATTCTATVTDTGAAIAAPTGQVGFSSDSSGAVGSGGACALAPTGTAGVASCQLTYAPAAVGSGTHTLTASYAGDGGHVASQGSTAVGVSAAMSGGGSSGGSSSSGSPSGGGSSGGGSGGAVTPTVPTVSALGESNSTFAVGSASTPLTGATVAARHKRGTVFTFVLDQPATVRVAIQRLLTGRRVGGSCKPQRPALRRERRCTRVVTVAKLTRSAFAGRNRLPFSGRIGGAALKPGRYRALFTASGTAGSSKPAPLSFSIVAR